MGATDRFNIESALNNWEKINCSKEDMTPEDVNDMREHMLLTIRELIDEQDLTEEEAFAVACVRFGGKDDWAEEMQMVNGKNLQFKKIVLLLGGVFLFVFINYFTLVFDKILFLILNHSNGIVESNIEPVRIFMNTTYLIIIFFFIAAFFMHKPILLIFDKMKFRLGYVILFIFVTFLLKATDWFLIIHVTGTIKDDVIISHLFHLERNFKNYFLLISGIGYSILLIRYRQKFSN